MARYRVGANGHQSPARGDGPDLDGRSVHMSGDQVIDQLLTPAFATINLAYVTLLIGAFSKSLDHVRVLLVLAAAFFVSYGLLQDIGSMVVWNLVIGGLNLFRLLASLWERTRISLTVQQETLRRQLFAGLAPAAFRRLWELGDDVLCVDERLVEAGVAQDRIFLVIRGTVRVERDGAVLEMLGPGAVIGQLEPLRFSSPSADWRAAGAVWLRTWALTDLAERELAWRALRFPARQGHVPAGAAA